MFLQFKGNCFPKDIQIFFCVFVLFYSSQNTYFFPLFCVPFIHGFVFCKSLLFIIHVQKGKCLKYSILNIQYMKHIFCCIPVLKCIHVDLNIENKLCNQMVLTSFVFSVSFLLIDFHDLP